MLWYCFSDSEYSASLEQHHDRDDRPAPVAEQRVQLRQQPEQRLRDEGEHAVVDAEVQRPARARPSAPAASGRPTGGCWCVACCAGRERRAARRCCASGTAAAAVLPTRGLEARCCLAGARHPGGDEVVLQHADPAAGARPSPAALRRRSRRTASSRTCLPGVYQAAPTKLKLSGLVMKLCFGGGGGATRDRRTNGYTRCGAAPALATSSSTLEHVAAAVAGVSVRRTRQAGGRIGPGQRHRQRLRRPARARTRCAPSTVRKCGGSVAAAPAASTRSGRRRRRRSAPARRRAAARSGCPASSPRGTAAAARRCTRPPCRSTRQAQHVVGERDRRARPRRRRRAAAGAGARRRRAAAARRRRRGGAGQRGAGGAAAPVRGVPARRRRRRGAVTLLHCIHSKAATTSQAISRKERVWFMDGQSSGARGACQEAVGGAPRRSASAGGIVPRRATGLQRAGARRASARGRRASAALSACGRFRLGQHDVVAGRQLRRVAGGRFRATWRRMRLRPTARLSTRLDTVMPRRARASALGRGRQRMQAETGGPETRSPRRTRPGIRPRRAGARGEGSGGSTAGTAHASVAVSTGGAIAAGVRRRGARGPWRGDGPGSCGRRRSPCGHGNRGRACA